MVPEDMVPAEFQISCGGGGRNAEHNLQYGRPYPEITQNLRKLMGPRSEGNHAVTLKFSQNLVLLMGPVGVWQN